MKTFDPTKPVQTRDGRTARILCTDFVSTSGSILAVIRCHDGTDDFRLLYADGLFNPSRQPSPYDLVNVPVKIERWHNVYRDGETSCFQTRAQADENAPYCSRIACVLLSCTEGDGLPAPTPPGLVDFSTKEESFLLPSAGTWRIAVDAQFRFSIPEPWDTLEVHIHNAIADSPIHSYAVPANGSTDVQFVHVSSFVRVSCPSIIRLATSYGRSGLSTHCVRINL